MTIRKSISDGVIETQMASINDSLREMMVELKSLGEKINSLNVDSATQIERRIMNEAKLERMDHVIFGNGKDGLITRLDRIEQTKTHMVWIIGLVVGVLGSIIGSIVPLVIHALHLFGN